MKTATVREVQHGFRHLLDWVAKGESVEVTRRGQVVAQLVPPQPRKPRKIAMPDFLARMRRFYPHKPVSDRQAAELVADMRSDR